MERRYFYLLHALFGCPGRSIVNFSDGEVEVSQWCGRCGRFLGFGALWPPRPFRLPPPPARVGALLALLFFVSAWSATAQQLGKYMATQGYTTTLGKGTFGTFNAEALPPKAGWAEARYGAGATLIVSADGLATVQAFCTVKGLKDCGPLDLADARHVAWPPGTKASGAKSFYDAVILLGVTPSVAAVEQIPQCPPTPKCPECPRCPETCIPPEVLVAASGAAYEKRLLPSEAQTRLQRAMPWLANHLCKGAP